MFADGSWDDAHKNGEWEQEVKRNACGEKEMVSEGGAPEQETNFECRSLMGGSHDLLLYISR